jgi:hypothetical protein
MAVRKVSTNVKYTTKPLNSVKQSLPALLTSDHGMVSDIYATLNATHSLRNISVEIHSMYTTNLALAIRSTNLEH